MLEQKEMDEIVEEIDEFIVDLLVPARTEKKANEAAFLKLDTIICRLKSETLDNKMLSKKLIGILFSTYISLNAEANHCKYDEPLFQRVAQLESDLYDLFH